MHSICRGRDAADVLAHSMGKSIAQLTGRLHSVISWRLYVLLQKHHCQLELACVLDEHVHMEPQQLKRHPTNAGQSTRVWLSTASFKAYCHGHELLGVVALL